MKKQRESKIIATLLLISITGAFTVLGQTVTNKHQLPIKEISEYKSWSKVTPKPHPVLFNIDGISSWDATFLIVDEKQKSKFKEPIRSAPSAVYGEVYINEIAAKAAETGKFLFTEIADKNDLEKGAFSFPTGSIIVREKIVVKDKPDVKSLAVMIKRERSFDPQSEGWQFLNLDPKTLAVTKDDQAACLSCHSLKKETDFVFNSYRP